MQKFWNNLKTQAEENPILALAVGAAVLTATTKLIQAQTDRENARSWAKEVDRRRIKTLA